MPKTKIINSAGITAAIGLASLPVFLTLAPMYNSGLGLDNAHAETTETLGASATINSTLGLSADSISMIINPTSNGSVFKTGKTVATVSTNNETGYTLYLSDSDADNSLKHKNLADKAINSIDPTTPTLTGNNMQPNTWGYTLGNSEVERAEETNNETNLALSYSPIPTIRTTIKKTDIAVSNERTPITFGVKVNTEIPSGVYSDQVSITAIPNYNTTAYPDSTNLWLGADGTPITTMQEMTHDVCASVPTPLPSLATGLPEIDLEDTRDGNSYKVRKLADGNCWMVESLKIAGIDSDHSRVLTSADSNVTTDFELPARVALGDTEFSLTTAYVSGGGTGGSWGSKDMTGINGTYLYNWYAATAGTGTGEVMNASAPDDICPKGWQLPNAAGNKSWNKLLRVGQGVYEIVTSDNEYTSTKVNWGFYGDDTEPHLGIKHANGNPLGLQLTGNFWLAELTNPHRGQYWTRTATSDSRYAYNLIYDSGAVYPQYSNDHKAGGFAVRCVAKD